MVCTNNKLTKIANIDEFWFALIFGLIISMIVISLIVSNISVIEKKLHIPEYEEVTKVCLTPTCLFPLKLDEPEMQETRPTTITLLSLLSIIVFSFIGHFIHIIIIDKVYNE